MTTNISKRPRIMRGQLVASTNPVKVSCIKVLIIEHRYHYLSYRRVSQTVINNE